MLCSCQINGLFTSFTCEDIFLPCQFSNTDNPEVHYLTTGPEIESQLDSIGLKADALVAGVGGGATFAALTVLSAMGLPVALVGLLIAIEPLIDMGRTLVNVSDSMLAGLISSKRMGELDLDVYNSPINSQE